jgi:hypothetical protein
MKAHDARTLAPVAARLQESPQPAQTSRNGSRAKPSGAKSLGAEHDFARHDFASCLSTCLVVTPPQGSCLNSSISKLSSVRHSSHMAKPTKSEMFAAIRRARGSLRRKPGDKPFAVQWAEHKAEEIEMEERKLRRHR